MRLQACVPSLDMSGEASLECDMREVEGRKLAESFLKGHGGLRQTSVAILNFDTDVTDELKWRLSKAAQQLQIPLICTGRAGSEVLMLGGSTRIS